MGRHRLYCPEMTEGLVQLAAEEAHHAVTVLRARVGDSAMLFDGAGREGIATIVEIDRRNVKVNLQQITQRPFDLPRRVTLAVAMCKQHRQAYLIEKCTELGVAAILPLVSDRSVVIPDRAAVEKWSRRAIEAAKQSERAWIPAIHPPVPFADALTRCRAFDKTILTDLSSEATPLMDVIRTVPSQADVLILVGPEGGWTDTERQQAQRAGAISVTLAPTILRTETAAVAVCAVVAALAPEREGGASA